MGAQRVGTHGQHHHVRYALPRQPGARPQRVTAEEQIALLQPVQVAPLQAGPLAQQALDGRDTQRHTRDTLRQTERAHPPATVQHRGVDQRRMVEMLSEQMAELIDRSGTVQLQAASQEMADEIGRGFQLAHRFLQRMAMHRHQLIHGHQQAETEKGAQQQAAQGE
ncbi:hypothetical protein D3C81_1103600 [compost metagenome]